MDGQRQVVYTRAKKYAWLFCAVNFCFMVLAVAQLLLLLYEETHDDCVTCVEPLYWFYGGNWTLLFIISLLGILGAHTNTPIVLWIYLIVSGLICIALFVLFVTGLNITMQNNGHHVDGLRFKEYQLQDYSSWILKQINNSHSWDHYYKRRYLELNCSHISEIYKTREEYQLARLDPTEAGCCRPPSECGYPAIDASYYNLSIPPTSSHKDCKLYKNSNAIKCFNCDSCKAGVAQGLKGELKSSICLIVTMLVILLPVLCLGCRVRQDVEKSHRNKAFIHPIVTLPTDF